jgi:hypothetical protein
MAEERDPEELINDAMDLIALGYPFDGTAAEKTEWMAMLQAALESREPMVAELLQRALRDD